MVAFPLRTQNTIIWELIFMDHVVRQKLNEIRRKQLASQEILQTAKPPVSSNDKSQYLVALGGVAVGLIIAVIAWLARSLLISDGVSIISPDPRVAIHASRITETTGQINLLNDRIESLTESIHGLESRLKRVMELTDSISDIGMKHTPTSQQPIPDTADIVPASDKKMIYPSRASDPTNRAEQSFIPTHSVKAKLNLRPAMSLDTRPIAVLQAGTEVQYIHGDGNWFYVNTEKHGKGWCASEYLSPLPPAQRVTKQNLSPE
jgi:hypothetical protein